MAGKTGYDAFNNANPPTGPDQMNDLSAHFDALIDGIVAANAAALPSSGNWPWRRGIASDTGILYVNPKGDATWVPWESDSITYTPTLTGVTLGNGSVTGRYRYVGGLIVLERIVITFGSTTSITSSVIASLPVTAAESTVSSYSAKVNRPGVFFNPLVVLSSTTIVEVQVMTGSPVGYSALTNTNPGNFGAGAVIEISGFYRPA